MVYVCILNVESNLLNVTSACCYDLVRTIYIGSCVLYALYAGCVPCEDEETRHKIHKYLLSVHVWSSASIELKPYKFFESQLRTTDVTERKQRIENLSEQSLTNTLLFLFPINQESHVPDLILKLLQSLVHIGESVFDFVDSLL